MDINEARQWCEKKNATISFNEDIPEDEVEEGESIEDLRVCVKMRDKETSISYKAFGRTVVEAVFVLQGFSSSFNVDDPSKSLGFMQDIVEEILEEEEEDEDG